MSNTPEVIVSRKGGAGLLTLNRPSAINALTTNMCRLMTDALLQWRMDPAVKVVVIDHAEGRGFCAGGDIRMLAESGAGDTTAAREFFHTEYRLNELLFYFPKPTVVFMDGITMGGGVGISRPCRFRVATERTLFAMPETGIGLFPDVGGGWFLSRMVGRAGVWLGLTGARLNSADCLFVDIANAYVRSERLSELKASICNCPDLVRGLIKDYSSYPGRGELEKLAIDIDDLFAGETLEQIVSRLSKSPLGWAKEQLEVLSKKSPTALKVTLRQLLQGGTAKSFSENMAMEYRVAVRMVQQHDFHEGVRAVIVDKDNTPQWNPPALQYVSGNSVSEIFAPLPAVDEWSPLQGHAA